MHLGVITTPLMRYKVHINYHSVHNFFLVGIPPAAQNRAVIPLAVRSTIIRFMLCGEAPVQNASENRLKKELH